MSDLRLQAASDRESALLSDDKLELKLWLRLLTCSNLIEGEVARGCAAPSPPRCRASTCWRSSTARRMASPWASFPRA